MRVWQAYIGFQWQNYLRTHRYLREIAAMVIFAIFFGGFLSDPQGSDGVWLLFAVFAILLTSMSAPSLFFLEQGNALQFLISKPLGRRRFYLSKIVLIVLLDVAIVGAFAMIFGLRFLSLNYFLWFPLRLALITLMIALITALIGLTHAYRPTWSWWIITLIIFGGIVNKGGVLPIAGINEAYKLLVFLLPPLQELSFMCVSLQFTPLSFIFLTVALGQLLLLLVLGLRGTQHKDYLL